MWRRACCPPPLFPTPHNGYDGYGDGRTSERNGGAPIVAMGLVHCCYGLIPMVHLYNVPSSLHWPGMLMSSQ